MSKSNRLALDTGPNMLLNSLYRTPSGFFRFSKSFQGLGIVSDTLQACKGYAFFVGKIMETTTENFLDLLATKLAELYLSEVGYHFIPGITPLWNRSKKFVEAKAFIVKKGSIV